MEAFPFQFRDTSHQGHSSSASSRKTPGAGQACWAESCLPSCSQSGLHPHGFLCSCALGKALINARRRTPTATSGFFLAAEAKSQVLWPGARRSAQGYSPTEDFLCPTWPSGQRPKSLVWGARPHVWHPVGCGTMVNSIGGPPNSVFIWEHKARSTFEGR